jgi:hypothetical protein
VPPQRSIHFIFSDIVKECALADGIRHCSAQKTITGAENSSGGFGEEGFIKLVMVHGETSTRKEVEKSAVLSIGDELAVVGECSAVGHIDGDSVAMAEGGFWNKFVEG